MKIKVIQVGKTKTPYLLEAKRNYMKLVAFYSDLEILTLRGAQISESANKQMRSKAVEMEGKMILEAIPKDHVVIALSEDGKAMNSQEFALKMKEIKDYQSGKVVFIIGGAFGLAEHVKAKADLLLSFSNLTFTHEMIRVLLMEQIYRAFTIMNNKTYHY